MVRDRTLRRFFGRLTLPSASQVEQQLRRCPDFMFFKKLSFMEQQLASFFAPQLIIPSGIKDLHFYEHAFGATTVMYLTNDDGTIHVAEMSVGGSIFHVHEENAAKAQRSPAAGGCITCIIGLFVPDVDQFMNRALAAGARLVSPTTDYEYGYRQGEIRDVFGHLWLIQQKIR